MRTTVVEIPAAQIVDWESFHSVFQASLGFPAFYGRNMNAWIDCLSYVDESDGMTRISLDEGGLLALRIDNAPDFERRCPDQFRALLECAAFVNHRRIEGGKEPLLTLILSGWFGAPS